MSSRFSKNNEIELSAGGIRFTFFNKIEVSDLLLKDNTADTMFYAPKLKAGIRKIKPKEGLISLGKIELNKPVIKFQPDTNNVLNLTHIMQLLAKKDTLKKDYNILISKVGISNGRLSYRSGSRPDTADIFDVHNFSLSGINLTLDDLSKNGKDLAARISDLSFLSGSGFELKSFFTDVQIEEDKFHLIDPAIRTANSFISSEVIGLDIVRGGNDFKFTRDANLEVSLQSSTISLSDLAYFVRPLKGMDKGIILSGKINGPVEEIKGRDIIMSYSDSTTLVCDFDLSGLPDIDNTFMFIRVGTFTSTTHEVANLELPGTGKITLGDEFMRLGAISFSGNFTGFLQDFVTYGTITTELGSLSTDILFRPDTSDTFYYRGTLQAESIRLGKILNREDILGPLSASLEVDGISRSFKNFRAEIDATVTNLEFKEYTYRDIEISGLVTEKIWDGKVSSNTEDLKMDLLGRFDFTGALPEVDFSLNLLNADLYELNLDRADSLSKLSMLLTANFTGNAIDNLSGDIRLLNSKLKRNGDEFDLFDCSISAFIIDSTKMGIDLRTDYIDADIRGKYDLTTIVPDIKITAASLFPSVINPGEGDLSGKNNFGYEISFKNTDRINEFFQTGFMLAPGFQARGWINPGSMISLAASGDYAIYTSSSMARPEINLIIEDTTMVFDINSD
ncbi:MAG: hypothetical protein RQ743_05685, partial [Bacteroidales bacterium]|nr:hypothetical protein [Bacteroidales bacterium]